jgi:hypothetical protein
MLHSWAPILGTIALDTTPDGIGNLFFDSKAGANLEYKGTTEDRLEYMKYKVAMVSTNGASFVWN